MKLKYLSSNLFFLVVSLLVGTIFSLVVFWIYDLNHEFDNRMQELKKEYIKTKENIIKREVQRAVNYINFEKNHHKKDMPLKDLQKEILLELKQVRFGKDGYLFIDTIDGINIMHPIKPSLEGKNLIDFKDSNGVYVKRELIKAAKDPNHPFVHYMWYQPSKKKISDKISYALLIDDWNWVVGSGIYIDDIDSIIEQKRAVLQKKISDKIEIILVIFFIILVIAIVLLHRYITQVRYNFTIFDKFLDTAHKKSEKLDISKIDFYEFMLLANSINNMIEKRVEIEEEISKKNKILSDTIEKLQTIFDLTMEMIVLTKDGIIIDLNRSSLEILGYTKDEVVGRHIFEFMTDEIKEKVKKALSKDIVEPYELYITKKDGTTIDILGAGRYIQQAGETIRVSTFIDITQIKQRDKAIAASKAKSEFLANMSHEIRTPLNAIMGFIDILKENEKDNEKQKYLEIITKSSQNLLEIINDILDFSKIESGKLDVENIDFDPKKEFEGIIYLFITKASQKNITLHVDISKDMPKSLNSDPLRIKQVIINLLSNAIKFTPKGRNIHIKIYYENSSLCVSIEDEGIGISEDKLDHIFNPFVQEDSSTTRQYGGTGLGLSISDALIKLLGGELKVESEVGKGSLFYFCIPIKIGNKIKRGKTIDYSNITFENLKLLLVEDNRSNQMFMKVLLRKLNINLDIANDGIEAIEKFKRNQYDIILMDENMPNMSGIEATKYIIEYEKSNNLKHTPIVALTANALKWDREKFLDAGMDEYLTKPLNKKNLVIIIKKMIEEYKK